jgi:hypothetical protein
VGLTKAIKTLLVCGSVLGMVVWFASARSSQAVSPVAPQSKPAAVAKAANADEPGYVGTDACKDCHEDQFKAYSHTSHSQLSKIGSWKGKATGCESCHGPGKDHIAEGDPAKIISFKNKTSKETAETCLGCHAGKELLLGRRIGCVASHLLVRPINRVLNTRVGRGIIGRARS